MYFSSSFVDNFFASEIKIYVVTTITALSAVARRKHSSNEEDIEL